MSKPGAERLRPSVGAVRRRFAPWDDPASVPLIRFEGVTRRFGSVTAVDRLDLGIHDRELFCLLGPSGCGKTTLMRMLAGFETPDEGRILLDGIDITAVPPHRRPVNMMFQSYALFPHLTVAGNVGFGLRQEGRPRREIAERVAAMLDLVQLKGFDDRKPHQLSGGQRQRVALARALAKEPRVLLLDEPLGALDKKTREETQFELMDLQSRLGATFVVVTHDQEEAMTMADRIAVMDKGRLAQVGTPAQVYEQPASRAIAAFIGDVNLFEGLAGTSADGLIGVTSPAFAEPLRVEAPRDAVEQGQGVAVAVRPEKIAIGLAEGSAPAGANAARGEIWDIGYLGDWTVFFVRLSSGQIVRVSRANAERHVARPISWDDMVDIRFEPEAGVVLTR